MFRYQQLSSRQYSLMDSLIIQVDMLYRARGDASGHAIRPSPYEKVESKELNLEEERASRQKLKRVLVGELMATAFQRGAALTTLSNRERTFLIDQAANGNDRLVWCQSRLKELSGNPVTFKSFLYISSMGAGAVSMRSIPTLSSLFMYAHANTLSAESARELDELPAQDLRTRQLMTSLASEQARSAYRLTPNCDDQKKSLAKGSMKIASYLLRPAIKAL